MNSGYGSALQPWQYIATSSQKPLTWLGSYTLNGYFYSDSGYGDTFTKESSVRIPSQTPVFGDGQWVDAWPEPTDPPPPSLYTDNDSPPGTITRFCIARHGNAPPNPPSSHGALLMGGINMYFIDGHSQLVQLESLWNQYWNTDWTPRATPP